MSHQKKPAGQTAANLKTVFDRDMGGNHFIDVEDLPIIDLESLIKAVRSTDVLVLLLTKDVMTRPWCLVEIYTALTHGVPIVPVELELHSDQSWPATGRARRVKWPTDEELRRICLESGGTELARWLECLPAQPPEEVERFHDALRDKLKSYKRRKYDTQEHAMVKSGQEGVIMEDVCKGQDMRRNPVQIHSAELELEPEPEPEGSDGGLHRQRSLPDPSELGKMGTPTTLPGMVASDATPRPAPPSGAAPDAATRSPATTATARQLAEADGEDGP